MNLRATRVFAFVLGCALCAGRSTRAQGPLAPPGPPSETMRTLEQVEPRTPIGVLPYTITQLGAYYLTADLECDAPGTNGITVTADRVMIDLRGFSIVNRAVVPTGSGILQYAPASGLYVCNGTLENWRDSDQAGIRVDGPGAQVTDVTARRNDNGLIVGPDARIERCGAYDNAGQGIVAGRGAVLRACSVSGNGNGITAGPGSLVENTAIVANNHGMYAQCGALVRGCTLASNTLDGVMMMDGGQICDCVAESNGEDGIELGIDCTACHNHVRANGRTGINTVGGGNAIDANTVVGNGVNVGYGSSRAGILVGGPGNIVVRNRLSANQVNGVNIASGNQVGVVIPPAPGAPGVVGNTGGGIVGVTDPFANIVY